MEGFLAGASSATNLNQKRCVHSGHTVSSRAEKLLRPGSPVKSRRHRKPGPVAILLWALFLFSVSACEKEKKVSSDTAPDSRNAPAILFLGDSLTAGLGLEKYQAAPALIQKKIDEQGWNLKVINGGVSGDTTAGGLSRLDWYLRKENNVKYLIIGLGSNDGMRGLPVTDMKENIRKIVSRTRNFDPQITILMYELQTFPSMGPDYANRFKQAFPELAKELNITLIDFPLDGVAGKDELNQDDGIHPNVEGTRIMAENIWKTIEPILAKDQ